MLTFPPSLPPSLPPSPSAWDVVRGIAPYWGAPVMRVRLTQLQGGGSALSISIAHTVLDAKGVMKVRRFFRPSSFPPSLPPSLPSSLPSPRPVMRVRLTQLQGGGSDLSVSVAHTVLDAKGVMKVRRLFPPSLSPSLPPSFPHFSHGQKQIHVSHPPCLPPSLPPSLLSS